MTPVVFLDLDGVCNDDAFIRAAFAGHGPIGGWNPELAFRTLDPLRVARVQAICDRTGAVVVIVSGWRWVPAETITDCLRHAGLTAPVLGAVGGVRMHSEDRVGGTAEWLAAHPEATRWAIVDDTRRPWSRELWGDDRWEARLVCPRDGITEEDVERVVAILGGAQ